MKWLVATVLFLILLIPTAFVLFSSAFQKEVNLENKYDDLLSKVEQSQSLVDSVIIEATKKEASIIDNTVEGIIETKSQLEQLTSKAPDTVFIRDTIIIRDTVIIKEKKSLFGKSKIDTLQ